MKNFFLFISAVCLFNADWAEAQSRYFLSPEETGGGQILAQKTYDGTSLWGYINGAADLYFEYGFQTLYLQEILWDNRRYKTETYVMSDAESAFGIFSVSRFKCQPDRFLPVLNCASPYHLQFVRGTCYVSVSHSGASNDDITMYQSIDYMRFLAGQLIPKIQADSFPIPVEFRDTLYTPALPRLLLIKGPLGLMNGYPDWLPLFERCPWKKMYVLPVFEDAPLLTLALIHFENENTLSIFLNLTGIQPMQKGEWTFSIPHRPLQTGILLVSGQELFFVQSNRPVNELDPFLKPMKQERKIIMKK